MFTDAELVLISYKPLILERGMLFFKKTGSSFDFTEVYELDEKVMDAEAFMSVNGYPVRLSLFEPPNYNSGDNELASHEEIAWVDEGEDSDEMHEITVQDINSILQNEGRCQIKISEKFYVEEKMIVPLYDEEKVIIKLIDM